MTMKSSRKLATALLAMLFLAFSVGGCVKGEDKIDLTNTPDYSQSAKQFTIWAYDATLNNWYMYGPDGNKTVVFFEDGSPVTAEYLQDYKDAGFNYLFINGSFQDNASAERKKIMDLAHDAGLKVVLFGCNLHSLSSKKESLINPSKADGVNFFESQEALNSYVADYLRERMNHPAFAGVSIIDEPDYSQFDAISEVCKAILAACGEDVDIMLNLLPFAANSATHKTLYSANGLNLTSEAAYREYLETYYQKVGSFLGYLRVDDYPILQQGLLPTYLYGHQSTSEFCKEKGLERRFVMQSIKYSNRRIPQEADYFWQSNMSMAFGNKEFSYYTYAPPSNTLSNTPLDESNYLVGWNGNKNKGWYSVKNANSAMQFFAKALMNFEYQGMRYVVKTPLPNGMDYLAGIKNDTFQKNVSIELAMKMQTGGMALCTELYDAANGQYGYFVVNGTDPIVASAAEVTLTFEGYNYVQIYQYGQIVNIALQNGKVTLELGTGRGAFLMPF